MARFKEWKAEVQEVARRQLSRQAHVSSKALEYFKLLTELEAARKLSAYHQSGAFTDSLLCSDEMQQVRSLTTEVVKGIEGKERKVRQLEKELLPDSGLRSSEERSCLIEESRVELAETAITSCQVEIEALLHSLEKYKQRVSNEADSAKMRASLRRKEADVKKQIDTAVNRYNGLIALADHTVGRKQADAQVLLESGELPWQYEHCPDETLRVDLVVHRTVAFRQKLELVEAFNLVQRLSEEESILIREQENYSKYHRELVDDLEKLLKAAELGKGDHSPSI